MFQLASFFCRFSCAALWWSFFPFFFNCPQQNGIHKTKVIARGLFLCWAGGGGADGRNSNVETSPTVIRGVRFLQSRYVCGRDGVVALRHN